MNSQIKCPVCGSIRIDKENNKCKSCLTDLSLWNLVIDLPDRFYTQALQMINANRINEAKEKLIAALEFYPEHINSQMLLGKVYAELEMFDDAITVWEKLLEYNPENAKEIEELILKAKRYREEIITRKEEEKKRWLEEVREKTIRKTRSHWIVYSTLFFVIVLSIGVFLHNRFPVPPVQTTSSQADVQLAEVTELIIPDFKQMVEKMLEKQNINDIQVEQDKTIIYLSGKVLVMQDKYQLENLIRKIVGITALDIRKVEVLYPKGYFYTVRKGDNLWSIAERKCGSGFKYKTLYQVNKEKLIDAAKIDPGVKILIPE